MSVVGQETHFQSEVQLYSSDHALDQKTMSPSLNFSAIIIPKLLLSAQMFFP